jgi:hypothetical protein
VSKDSIMEDVVYDNLFLQFNRIIDSGANVDTRLLDTEAVETVYQLILHVAEDWQAQHSTWAQLSKTA